MRRIVSHAKRFEYLWLVVTGGALIALPGMLGAQQEININVGAGTVTTTPDNKVDIKLPDGPTTIVLENLPASQKVRILMSWQGGTAVLNEDFFDDLRSADPTRAEFTIAADGVLSAGGRDFNVRTPLAIRVFVDGTELEAVRDVLAAIGQGLREVGAARSEEETPEDFVRRIMGRRFREPYDNDSVYLFFDPNGRQIGRTPSNVDQDDLFVIGIVARRNEVARYDVRVDVGEYAPSDLAIRPTEQFQFDAQTQSDRAARAGDPWFLLKIHKGPFTSGTFEFAITYQDPETEQVGVLNTHEVRINKLYHLALGVSFMQSRLGNPTFKTSPLTDTTNTILSLDGGKRNIITLNVVWYWRIFTEEFWRGGFITKGRDVLEEAHFFERIFPTFGVSINENLTENFFVGFVFEFARGGSIVATRHFGQVRRVAIPNFTLGQTVYSGTTDDIPITKEGLNDWAFGVMLDTRVLNSLLGALGQSGT